MTQMNLPSSSSLDARRLGAITLLVAVAQISLVALALGRVLDPGSMTFEAIGILVGLGMATGAFATAFGSPSRNHESSRRIGFVGIAAGLGYGAVWLSLIGGDISYSDVPRLAVLVTCDVVFTVWLLAAGRVASPAGQHAGIGMMALLMALRAIGEVVLCIPLLAPFAGSYVVLLMAGLVLVGWIVLALWEISLGLWLVRTRPDGARDVLSP